MGTTAWREKYLSARLQKVLRKATVSNDICTRDESGSYYIQNPYSSQVTAAIQTLTGTYSVSAWTTTNDTLTVTDEVVYGEHIFNFERVMSKYNLMVERLDEIAYAIGWGIDYFVLNNLCEDATGTYSTDAGGFTEPSNVPVILSNLASKVAGYADVYRGLFLVIENTDLPGFLQFGVSAGFSYADMVLNNGKIGSPMGIDVYVVRSGTFVSATIGSVSTITNDGHRVFGVKKVAWFCVPDGVRYDEKGVTGKTGKEICADACVGFKLWTQKASLCVDITIT